MEEIRRRYGDCLKEIERALHRHPEPAFKETRTTALILETLKRHTAFTPVDMGLETGVVARLSTGKPGPVIGLRADIDGIEQQEAVERPDRSEVDGMMHACGHDTHTAGLLGAAMALSAHQDALKGDVVLLFQPAEETIAGARYLIGHGLFDKAPMDALFGLHNTPALDVGKVGVKKGALMAAKDDYNIFVRGRGGHGGLPHLCVDPVVAACAMVGGLQTIVSRSVSPEAVAVVSVCSIHGGCVSNLIPDSVSLAGSARAFDPAVQQTVIAKIREIAGQTAQAYGCTAEVEHYATVPPLCNGELFDVASRAAETTVGRENVCVPDVSFASEDFSLYGAYLPTFFYFLGSGTPEADNAPWHSAAFRAAEDTPFYGAALLANSVLAAQAAL